jgi:glycosyltransferase involved in cell wall biosynthesis
LDILLWTLGSDTLRILINALSARVGGGVTFIQNILPALSRLDNQHTFIVLLSPRYQHSLIKTVPPGMKVIQVDLPAEPLARRWWYLQAKLPHLLNELQVDLFFAPCEGSYFRIPTRFVIMARNPSIYASLQSFGNQRLRLLLHRLIRQPLVFLSLQKADRVVFVSASFRDQIVRQMRVSLDKARIVYHGLSPIFWQPVARSKLLPPGQTYFISVSTINPHKNYETLLRAYAHLPGDAPHLVIAGKTAHKSTYHQLRMLVAGEGIENRVHFLGAVPYEELPSLYQGAIASVFPSRLETFGHPLVEAMASGTPVIASDLPVCREICRDAALYFTPDDSGALATHMRQLMHGTNLRDSLAQRGQKRARDFSWDESARKLVEVFEELV